jgi:CubicO group peptidase (beta-lactamase class C family)
MSHFTSPCTRLRRTITAHALVPAVVLAACARSGPAGVTPLAIEATLDARVPALLTRYGVASVSLAVIEDGRVVLERAYGEQSAGVPATPATLYGLASVTKPI